MAYIPELLNWPKLHWNDAALASLIGSVRHRQGRIVGRMQALGFAMRADATLRTLTEEIVKSSEIEGEVLSDAQVRSSLARRLGMNVAGLIPADRDVGGRAEHELLAGSAAPVRDRMTRLLPVGDEES